MHYCVVVTVDTETNICCGGDHARFVHTYVNKGNRGQEIFKQKSAPGLARAGSGRARLRTYALSCTRSFLHCEGRLVSCFEAVFYYYCELYIFNLDEIEDRLQQLLR